MKHLILKTPAFSDKGLIPPEYTCDGEDINPPFVFENVPEDAQSLVFLVEDPDSQGKTWLHWGIFNIDPHATGIHEDATPMGGTECMSDFGHIGYGGPCPAQGIHRYNFKLFALDDTLDLSEDSTLNEIYSAMDGHVLEEAKITGLYSRE